MMDVLLVDDEPWVLEGLRTMVNWDKFGFQICGEAENGNDAWAKIENLQPDLVITDIHMPSVSGLELIERSKKTMDRPPKFVILSGYDSFEYAKVALNQRVEEYLLKPIDEVEIEAVLDVIGRKIVEEHASAEAYHREHALYVNSLFNRLLQGDDSSELQDEVNRTLQMEGHENMACLLISTDNYMGDVKQHLQSFAGTRCSIPFTDSEGNIGLFAVDIDNSLKRLEELGRNLFEIYANLASIIVAFGYQSSGACAMRSAYEKALFALKWKRYQYKTGFIRDQDLPPKDGLAKVNQQALAGLMEAILSGETDKVEVKVQALLANPQSELTVSNIEYVRVQLIALEMGVLKQLNELEGNVDAFIQQVQNEAGDITGINSFPRFLEYGLMLSRTAVKEIQEQRKRKEFSTIFQVEQYVNQEFRENLRLQELAQKFHMNANYLGQAFKQQTGKSFREYLNDKRIDEAKRLLRQSSKCIADVAVHSGYLSTDYFISQFKRMTGMAPSQYRKLQ
ncbi:helix-turn-helix domain-containing protein [Paenibacillus shunpengii]|uniref:Helix-turn-helix domain-containing protein n=1 Tax=Paenibacillus shunpengii TaxID=2054424 RepID=A0ABW5SLE4_9BACL